LRVAALYDVHGMPHALSAVLDELAGEDVDYVVLGGDLIGGPFPRETVEFARSIDATWIRGNGEREPDAWDRRSLSPDVLGELAALPVTVSFDGVLYCHAAPDDDSILTTAATPVDVFEATFASANESVVVIGHTHHQFDVEAGSRRIVNAGSVGMAYEGEVAAYWAIVEAGEPSFRRTPFDVERAAAEISASGWPGALEFVEANLRAAPSRAEAIEHFERLRAA
jgi:predicted phosphodiesterase